MMGRKYSRCFSVNFLESFNNSCSKSGGNNTAAAVTGPAKHPLPASSVPTSKANPEKFAPQFGGYCAYGLSENHKSPTEPEAFTIVDDKLYLNYNLKVKELWKKDIPGRIKKANDFWPALMSKTAKQ